MKENPESAKLEIEALELKISYLLRYGVFASAAFLTLGWLGQFFLHPGSISTLSYYEPVPLQDMIQKAYSTQDYSVLSALIGLTMLVSLPVIRVFLTAYLFIRNKESEMALLAIFVSLILCFSFFAGIDL